MLSRTCVPVLSLATICSTDWHDGPRRIVEDECMSGSVPVGTEDELVDAAGAGASAAAAPFGAAHRFAAGERGSLFAGQRQRRCCRCRRSDRHWTRSLVPHNRPRARPPPPRNRVVVIRCRLSSSRSRPSDVKHPRTLKAPIAGRSDDGAASMLIVASGDAAATLEPAGAWHGLGGLPRDRLPINPHGANVTDGPWPSAPRRDHKQTIVSADERKLLAVRRPAGARAAGQPPQSAAT